MSELIGTTAGNWRLDRLLGEGAFGAVYEATNLLDPGQRAAVKILHAHLGMKADIKQRFINEAAAVSRAAHENVVQIYDSGTTPAGLWYAAMELLVGTTLSVLIKRGALGEARTIRLGVQIAAALEAAHQVGIVHRDLKPDNIFITATAAVPEFVKVLDFGICKLRGDVTGDAKLTSTGMILGTSGYMAPEQWMSRPDIDGRVDIYALGVILFECVTGRSPFPGNNAYDFMRMHIQDPPPDPARFGASPQLARVLLRMLAKEPGQRPPAMRAVSRELQAAAAATHRVSSADMPTLVPEAQRPVQPTPARASAPMPAWQPPAPAPRSTTPTPPARVVGRPTTPTPAPRQIARPAAAGPTSLLENRTLQVALGAVVVVATIGYALVETFDSLKSIFSGIFH